MYPASQQQLLQLWITASLLGLIPAFIAYKKGRNFVLWWFYGTMIFIVALFHSLLLKPKVKAPPVAEAPPEPHEQPLPEGTKKCVFCGQLIGEASTKCPVCKGVQPAPHISPPVANSGG